MDYDTERISNELDAKWKAGVARACKAVGRPTLTEPELRLLVEKYLALVKREYGVVVYVVTDKVVKVELEKVLCVRNWTA